MWTLHAAVWGWALTPCLVALLQQSAAVVLGAHVREPGAPSAPPVLPLKPSDVNYQRPSVLVGLPCLGSLTFQGLQGWPGCFAPMEHAWVLSDPTPGYCSKSKAFVHVETTKAYVFWGSSVLEEQQSQMTCSRWVHIHFLQLGSVHQSNFYMAE